MTSVRDPYIDVNLFDEPDNQEENDDGIIFSTNAGEVAIEVNDQYVNHTSNKISVSDHILMIQCGYLLTRKNHEIKGLSKHKHFLQRICATSIGKSVPLRYPEAMFFHPFSGSCLTNQIQFWVHYHLLYYLKILLLLVSSPSNIIQETD